MNAVTKIKESEAVPSTGPHVFTAVAAVMAEMAREGISKDGRNAQQGYNFRGIDHVFNALAPVLSRNGLVIFPRVTNRECVERTTQKGGVLFYVTCAVEFTLASAQDGSTIVVTTYGEAMDSADKATNKAMSAAYKYMALQTFCIPTEGDNDADATTHEVSGFVTAAEAAHLEGVADEVGARKDAFLKAMGVAAFNRFAAKDYDKALAALERKRAQTFRGNGAGDVAGHDRQLEVN